MKPLQRAGNRRYYRPADVAVAQRIDQLLNRDGYTMRGVQKLLADDPGGAKAPPPAPLTLASLRDALVGALAEDGG